MAFSDTFYKVALMAGREVGIDALNSWTVLNANGLFGMLYFFESKKN